MTAETDLFWKRVAASKLLADRECERARVAAREYFKLDTDASAEQAAQFLAAKALLTKFQASMLLADKVIPFHVGHYVIQERVESGPLAKQWLALHRPTGHRVLLYKLSKEEIASEESRRQVCAQVLARGKLHHPHLWRVFDFVEMSGSWFVVMEWPRAQPLVDQIASSQTIEAETLCTWIGEVSRALIAMRTGDVSPWAVFPREIWIDDCGRARVLQYPLTAQIVPDVRLGRFISPLPNDSDAPFIAPELLEPLTTSTEGSVATSQQGIIPSTALTYSLGRILAYAIKLATSDGRMSKSAVSQSVRDFVASTAVSDPEKRLQSLEEVSLAATSASGKKQTSVVAPPSLLAYERWLDEHARKEAGPRSVSMPENSAQGRAKAVVAPSVVDANTPAPKAPQSPNVQKVKTRSAKRKAGLSWLAKSAIATGALAGIWAMLLISGVLQKSKNNAVVTAAVTQAARGDGKESSHASPPSSPKDLAANGSTQQNITTQDPSQSFEVVSDDGRTPWASPTEGEPLAWRWIPPAAACVLVIRPADLLHSSEGIEVVQTAQSLGWSWQQEAEAYGISDLHSVEQYWWTAHPSMQGLQISRVFHCTKGFKALSAGPEAIWKEVGGVRYVVQGEEALYSPQEAPHVLVATHEEQLLAMIEEGESGTPRREFRELLSSTDSRRALSMLLAPRMLVSEASGALAGPGDSIRSAMMEWCGSQFDALLLSLHPGKESDYLELQTAGDTALRVEVLRDRLKFLLNDMSSQLAAWCESNQVTQYNALLLMVQATARYARVGVQDRHALANVYLPKGAIVRLVTGVTQMLLSTSGSGGDLAASTKEASDNPREPSGEDPKGKGDTTQAKLAKGITLSFRQESFEDALTLLGQEMGVNIQLNGAALEKEGITKNQPIRNLNMQDKPAEQVLNQILQQANPAGKLKYDVRPGGEIVVTTISAESKAKGKPNKKGRT